MELFSRMGDACRGLRWAANRTLRVLGGLALIALLLTAFVRDLSQFPRSLTWPSARGKVVQSDFIRDDDFSVAFRYRYTVGDRTYEASRITFFQYAVFANVYQNEQFIEQHPVGSAVDVYYDPGDPTQAVVMRMIPLSQLWSPLLLALCLLGSLTSAVIGLLLRGALRLGRCT